MRLPGLRAVLRHVRPRLPLMARRAGVHAAAGPAGRSPPSCRAHWQVRFVDENIRPASAERFRLGRRGLRQRHARPAPPDPRHRAAAPRLPARSIVLGGPSVSACPELYPDFDYLHIGELGDATDALIAAPRRRTARAPPRADALLTTAERLPLTEFPLPAYRARSGSTAISSAAPVLQRLPLSLRVLRHPGALRPRSRGSRRRSRSPPSSTPCWRRRRHRPRSISSTTISSATARRRGSCCRI